MSADVPSTLAPASFTFTVTAAMRVGGNNITRHDLRGNPAFDAAFALFESVEVVSISFAGTLRACDPATVYIGLAAHGTDCNSHDSCLRAPVLHIASTTTQIVSNLSGDLPLLNFSRELKSLPIGNPTPRIFVTCLGGDNLGLCATVRFSIVLRGRGTALPNAVGVAESISTSPKDKGGSSRG